MIISETLTELYSENENAVQMHLEDYRKVFIDEAKATVGKRLKID